MASRHRARQVALRVLFQMEARPEDWEAPLAYHLEEEDLPLASANFARDLVAGVCGHLEEIDDLLRAGSLNWPLDQMGLLERSVLRLGAWELGWDPTTPVAVVIDEAVELAKQMGGADAARFVNGVLGAVAQVRRPQSGASGGTGSSAHPAHR